MSVVRTHVHLPTSKMIASLALGVVLLAGLYLASLGAVALLAPSRAARFLLGFAGTARPRG